MTENEMEGTSLADHVFEMAACMNAVLSEQAHRNEDLADESYARQRAIEQDGVCCGVCGIHTVDQIGELANGEPVCEGCADEIVICGDCGMCIPRERPPGSWELEQANRRIAYLETELKRQDKAICRQIKHRSRFARHALRYRRVWCKAVKAIEDATERARGGQSDD